MEILGFKVADVGSTFMYFSQGKVILISSVPQVLATTMKSN